MEKAAFQRGVWFDGFPTFTEFVVAELFFVAAGWRRKWFVLCAIVQTPVAPYLRGLERMFRHLIL